MMKRDVRGQSVVEFALALPLLVLLLVGLFDVGRAVYAYNTVNNAARDGARLAIVDQTVSHIEDRATSQAVSLGLDADAVDVSFAQYHDETSPCDAFVPDGVSDGDADGIRTCMAVVRVSYPYEAITPIIGQIMGSINLVGESRFRLDFYCEGPACPLGD